VHNKNKRGLVLAIGEFIIFSSKLCRPEKFVNSINVIGELPEVGQTILIDRIICRKKDGQIFNIVFWKLPGDHIKVFKTINFYFKGLQDNNTGYHLVRAGKEGGLEFVKVNKPQIKITSKG
jgi:hypothetical protein